MKAGFARLDITPEYQMPMAGYDRRKGLSKGELTPLYVSVLILGAKAPEIAICSYDLLGIDHAFCTEFGILVEERFNIPRKHLVVCATHTHSGPGSIFKNREGYDRDYVERLLDIGILALKAAIEDFAEARPFYYPVKVKGVASPRSSRLGPEAENYEMKSDVVRFSRQGGDILLCTFACHPTVLNEENLLFSRDLVGAAESCLESEGKAIFINGPCGDLSTRYTRRNSNLNEVTRLGSLWGSAVNEALKNTCCESMMKIRIAHGMVPLSGRCGMDEATRVQWMQHLKKHISACGKTEEQREYLSRLAVLERGPYHTREDKNIPIQFIDFGFLTFLCFPLELGSSFGQTCENIIRKALGKDACIICYAGGYEGYLPSLNPLSLESSYEDLASPYLHSAQTELLKGIERLLEMVKESN